MGKILCLDYGRRRIGVSMSDPLKLTAQPVDTWVDLSEKDMVFKIQIIVKNEGVERIVVGYPLTLRGQKGSSARKVERFIGMLSGAVPVPVVPWDERLSSARPPHHASNRQKTQPQEGTGGRHGLHAHSSELSGPCPSPRRPAGGRPA
jgi:putative transcription antitermination factor YqgF